MHVVIAPDCFTATLTASEAAAAMSEGWAAGAPHDTITRVPLSDGGPGFVEVLADNLAGRLEPVVVRDPLGRDVPAEIFLQEHPQAGPDAAQSPSPSAWPTAWVESAQACGLHLLQPHERDPRVTSTYGVGQLIRHAIELGARRVIVGLGGSGSNDAGAGLLAALGAGDPDVLGHGGAALGATEARHLAQLAHVRKEIGGIGVELVMATDVDSPLLGLKGASAVFAEQKGATPEQAQALESTLGHFAAVVARVLPPPTDLLTGTALRPERAPGAGAAGGLGYALTLLGARRVSGVGAVLDAVGFERLLHSADLVVSGEGRFDWQSLRGKVVVGVAEAANAVGVPAVVIAGQSLVGRRESMAAGLAGVYAVAERPADVAKALADPAATLAARTARVARTWSPRQ